MILEELGKMFQELENIRKAAESLKPSKVLSSV